MPTGPSRFQQSRRQAEGQTAGRAGARQSWTRDPTAPAAWRWTSLTRILSGIEQGDLSAAGQLFPLVYDRLRELSASLTRGIRLVSPGADLGSPNLGYCGHCRSKIGIGSNDRRRCLARFGVLARSNQVHSRSAQRSGTPKSIRSIKPEHTKRYCGYSSFSCRVLVLLRWPWSALPCLRVPSVPSAPSGLTGWPQSSWPRRENGHPERSHLQLTPGGPPYFCLPRLEPGRNGRATGSVR
jgi:hypothetical protein